MPKRKKKKKNLYNRGLIFIEAKQALNLRFLLPVFGLNLSQIAIK